jgi:hypothetical protein
VITAYNASYNTGDTINYRQQERTLTSLHHQHNQRVNAQPRRQFILDLQAWIGYLLSLHHEIILSMDANMSYDPDMTSSSHPLPYTPGIPILDKKHDGKLATKRGHLLIPIGAYWALQGSCSRSSVDQFACSNDVYTLPNWNSAGKMAESHGHHVGKNSR